MGNTYAVIGDPIDHSLSPTIHNAAFREMGMDHSYIAYRVPAGELADGVDAIRRVGIAGFNVTVPHKVGIMGLLDRADGDCARIGAANTVLLDDDGKLVGHNTDASGFMDPIWRRNLTVVGSKVLVIGAGGAARALVAAFAAEGAVEIVVANRTDSKAKELAGFAGEQGAVSSAVPLGEVPETARGCKFIVNGATLGMRGEESPVPEEAIGPDSIVYDIVYKPVATDLVIKARRRGAEVIYGYEMLVGQACLSFELWHGVKAPYEAMRRAVLGAWSGGPRGPGGGGGSAPGCAGGPAAAATAAAGSP